MLLKNKVICDHVKHNKDKLKMDDYLSALKDRSKNLRRKISIYDDKLKSINSKYRRLHIHSILYIYIYIN